MHERCSSKRVVGHPAVKMAWWRPQTSARVSSQPQPHLDRSSTLLLWANREFHQLLRRLGAERYLGEFRPIAFVGDAEL